MFKKLNSWLETSFTSAQFTYKEIRSMFFTLLLDQFFIMFIAMLSTAMVSSTGEAAIAAANMVNSINNIVVLLFSSIAIGGAVVIARAKGSGDDHSIRCALGETICLAGLVGLVFGALLIALSAPVVHLMYPRAEPLLTEYSIKYMRLVCLSFFPYAVFNAIFHAFRSLGDTRSALVLTVVVNVMHLVCSYLFINVMDMGIEGAGLSLIVARVVGVVLALVWLLIIHNEHHIRVRHMFHFSKRISREITKLAVPIASESALLQGGMLLVQVYLAYLTTTELAAHGVANSYMQMYNITGNGLTSLASTICGQCFGAKLYDETYRYNMNLIKVGRFIMLITVLILTPLSPLLLQLYSPSAQAMPIIQQCLLILSIALPTIYCDSMITPMTLRAAGDIMFPTIVSITSLFCCRLVLGYVLTITLGMGIPGVWIAMLVEWAIRTVLMRSRINSKKWMPAEAKASA
ncbi:MAG: MATE family efflux transporter [Clostridia bacterium]|nr:MATE family efflux transporter [Clostridia bacterium]